MIGSVTPRSPNHALTASAVSHTSPHCARVKPMHVRTWRSQPCCRQSPSQTSTSMWIRVTGSSSPSTSARAPCVTQFSR